MAKFTAAQPLNIAWHGNVLVGTSTTTYRIPDALKDEFDSEVGALIPGGMTWVEPDELADALPLSGGTVTGDVTFSGNVTADAARFKGGPWRDVKAYGAKGDGTTNDATAIAAALAAASDGDTIYFPSGVYIISSAVSASTRLNIVGNGATVKAGTDGLDSWITLTADNVHVSGFYFDAASRARTPLVISGSYVVIEDCYFTGYSHAFGFSTTDSGIKINSATDVAVRNCTFHLWANVNDTTNLVAPVRINTTDCQRISVIGCTFDSCSQGVIVNGGVGNVISGCIFTGLWDNPIYALAGCVGLSITGNTFVDNTDEQIVVECDDCQITGNVFRNFTNKGIAIQATSAGLSDLLISGNIFANPNSTLNGNAIAYRTNDAGTHRNVSIVGNTFRGTISFAAVLLQALKNAVIADNVFDIDVGASTNGMLYINGTASTDLIVARNIFINTGTDSTANGIKWVTSPTNVVLEGNRFVNCAHALPSSGQVPSSRASYGARVRNSANVNVPNNVATAITFDSERDDQFGFHSTSANTSRLTVPTGFGGKYLIGANISFASNSSGYREVYLLINGATVIALTEVPTNPSSITAVFVETRYALADGDYVEVWANQSSGVSLNVSAAANYSPEFWLERVGD